MKKVLSLLLAFILIFSCFSLLGTTAASAETESSVADPVVLKSDFEENVASSKWYISGDVQSMTEDPYLLSARSYRVCRLRYRTCC